MALLCHTYLGVSTNGVPKMVVYFMENPLYKWMMTGGTPMTQKTTIWDFCHGARAGPNMAQQGLGVPVRRPVGTTGAFGSSVWNSKMSKRISTSFPVSMFSIV